MCAERGGGQGERERETEFYKPKVTEKEPLKAFEVSAACQPRCVCVLGGDTMVHITNSPHHKTEQRREKFQNSLKK